MHFRNQCLSLYTVDHCIEESAISCACRVRTHYNKSRQFALCMPHEALASLVRRRSVQFVKKSYLSRCRRARAVTYLLLIHLSLPRSAPLVARYYSIRIPIDFRH